MDMNVVVTNYLNEIDKIKKSNAKLVDTQEYSDRLSKCKTCNFYEKYEDNNEIFRCTKCGCAGFNIMIKKYKCPLKPSKWK
tara:strand:+ start:4380 stop:4622 length:243 start_codon:yes stop_codon:yes gene_type:complete